MADGHKIKKQFEPHFVTFTIVGWVDFFVRATYREIFLESLKFCMEKRALKLHAFVIMTNHVHLIISSGGDYPLSDTIRNLKTFTAKRFLKFLESPTESRRDWMKMVFEYHAKFNSRNKNMQFWIQDNHPIELHSQRFILQKLNYIHLNPVKQGWVELPEHYLYSSARNYAGLNSKIEVDLIDI